MNLLIFKDPLVPCLVIYINVYPCLSHSLMSLKGILKIENYSIINIQTCSLLMSLRAKSISKMLNTSQTKIIYPGQALLTV